MILNIVFMVRNSGPGFPWNPRAEGVMSPPREGGYAAFPDDQDASDDNYQPPEY